MHNPYAFTGFLQPVDNPPTYNTAKAGAGIPVKFSLGGNQGLKIFAAGHPKSDQVSCSPTAPSDGIEQTVTAGSSGLTYNGKTQAYTYTWKTNTAWSSASGGGPCRQLTFKFVNGTKKYA
jgi:hypothetical protein